MPHRRAVLKGVATTALGSNLIGAGQRTTADLEAAGQLLDPDGPGIQTSEQAQYKGGPENQGYSDTNQQITGITNLGNPVKIAENFQVSRAPVTHPNGTIVGVNTVGQGAVIADLQNQEMTQVELTGEASHPIFDNNEKPIIGDTSGTHKIDPSTGEKVATLEGDNRAALKRHGETGYGNEPYGVAEFPLDNIEDSTKHDLYSDNPPTGALTIIEDGDILPMKVGSDIVSWDTERMEEIDRKNPESFNSVISTDGDHLFGTSTQFEVWDIPKSQGEEFERVATAPKEGGTSVSPPVVVQEDGSTMLYTTDIDTGIVSAYEFDGSSLTEEWSYDTGQWDPSTDGNDMVELVGVGDTIVASGVGLVGLDRNTGEEKFRNEDIVGRVGMPVDGVLPVGDPNNDGIYLLELEYGDSNDVNPGVVAGSPSQNLDKDELLEDIDGDGSGNVFDALTYYNKRNSDVITENPEHYDFDGDGNTGTLFDALELYNELT